MIPLVIIVTFQECACQEIETGKCWKTKKFVVRNWAHSLAQKIRNGKIRNCRVKLETDQSTLSIRLPLDPYSTDENAAVVGA